MCARAVEANLSTIDSSCVELGPCATVHLDVLARLGQSCEIRLRAVEALIWGAVTWDSGGGPVLKPLAHKAKWMTSPQSVWEGGCGGGWRGHAQGDGGWVIPP